MRKLFFTLLFILSGICLKAQTLLPYHDTTLQPGESISSFCIENQGGTINTLYLDDRYSTVINIGFPFSFFGNDYSHCIISDNLLFSFDTSFANTQAIFKWNNFGNNSMQFKNVILPAFMDLMPTQGGSIRYTTKGIPGLRKFVIEWCNIPKYDFINCINDRVSVQIVLHEGTNNIDVNTYLINGSTTCPSTNNNAKGIQGLINHDSTNFIFTPNRGISDMWGNIGGTENTVRFEPSPSGYTVNQSLAFRYEPIFIIDSFTNVSWYSSLGGAAIATGPCIDIPYDTAITYYVAKYNNYTSCDNVIRNLSDTIWVNSVDTTTPPPTGINDNKALQRKISIYPNPLKASEELNIKSDALAILNVKLINPFGQIIYQQQNANHANKHLVIPTIKLSKGIYLVLIETNAGTLSKKISLY